MILFGLFWGENVWSSMVNKELKKEAHISQGCIWMDKCILKHIHAYLVSWGLSWKNTNKTGVT